MGVDRDIENAIQIIAGTFKTDKVGLITGTVKSVDEKKATCICVIDGDAEIPDVNLQAGICDGLLIIPKVDSTVLIVYSTYNDPYIIQFSDVDKYTLTVGDSKIKVTNDGKFVFNDGKLGGMAVVANDDNPEAGLLKKINNLEDLVNNLLTALKGISVALAPSGTFPLAPFFASMQNLTTTQKSDIEDDKIKH